MGFYARHILPWGIDFACGMKMITAQRRRVVPEARRVLRPGGKLLFLEHGETPDAGVRKWQRRIDPVRKRLAGGCHTGRPIPRNITEAGWTIDRLEQGYIEGHKPLAFLYGGSARA